MTGAPRVDAIAIAAANATAIVGMVALGWAPEGIVFLYALDTALALYALTWLFVRHAGGALVFGTVLNLALVAPLVFMFGESAWVRSDPWRTAEFQVAIAMQVAGSIVALVRMHLGLAGRDDREPIVSRQFKFVVARWIVVLLAAGLLVGHVGDTTACVALVIVYAGASLGFALFPRWTNPVLGARD